MMEWKMVRDALVRHRVHRRLAAANPSLWMGRGVSVADTRFEEHNRIGDQSQVSGSSFGRYSYVGPRCIINRAAVGRYASIGPDVILGTGGHPLGRNAALHPLFYLHRPEMGWDIREADTFVEFASTAIGSDVWIGAKAIVRDGVTIGDGAVVGAGAVVVRDLDPFGIYVGAPARLVRLRYPEDVVRRLLALAWWNREPAWLRVNADLFDDMEALLAIA